MGATSSWDIWDWGKNWSGVKEAEAQANQAAIGRRSLGDQVAFDAQRRLLEARTAYETAGPGPQRRWQAAEEAYRIQSVRYAEGAATTTDVIDAETDVLARAQPTTLSLATTITWPRPRSPGRSGACRSDRPGP